MMASAPCAILLSVLFLACGPPEADRAQAGDITVLGGHAFAPVGPQAAAYVSLKNSGRTEDTLLAVGSPISDTVTLHESSREGGIVRMVQLNQLVMPAGMVVEMAPGDLHLMLLHLRVAMQSGKKLPLRLWFARAGLLEIEVPISRYGETR